TPVVRRALRVSVVPSLFFLFSSPALLDLIVGARPGILVRPPPHEPSPVPESAAAPVVVADLDDEHGVERLPLSRPFRGPARRPSGGAPREAGRLHERLELLRQLGLLLGLEARAEADVVEDPFVVVEPEEERPHERRLLRAVAEAADDAVGCPHPLHL